MARLVLGIFADRLDAEEVISRLEATGYNPKDMSIVMKDADKVVHDDTNHIADGAVSGVAAGGALGALAGLLIANGLFPGLGVLLVGGPIAAALGLTGAVATTVAGAMTGAAAGGILGALSGLGLSSEEANEYEESIRAGGILVVVPSKVGDDDEVRAVMQEYNAGQVRTINSSESGEISSSRRSGDEFTNSHNYR